jgi:hypothetical protein
MHTYRRYEPDGKTLIEERFGGFMSTLKLSPQKSNGKDRDECSESEYKMGRPSNVDDELINEIEIYMLFTLYEDKS